jgi:hypothetical protein
MVRRLPSPGAYRASSPSRPPLPAERAGASQACSEAACLCCAPPQCIAEGRHAGVADPDLAGCAEPTSALSLGSSAAQRRPELQRKALPLACLLPLWQLQRRIDQAAAATAAPPQSEGAVKPSVDGLSRRLFAVVPHRGRALVRRAPRADAAYNSPTRSTSSAPGCSALPKPSFAPSHPPKRASAPSTQTPRFSALRSAFGPAATLVESSRDLAELQASSSLNIQQRTFAYAERTGE